MVWGPDVVRLFFFYDYIRICLLFFLLRSFQMADTNLDYSQSIEFYSNLACQDSYIDYLFSNYFILSMFIHEISIFFPIFMQIIKER